MISKCVAELLKPQRLDEQVGSEAQQIEESTSNMGRWDKGSQQTRMAHGGTLIGIGERQFK